jgi:tetratricopeptide (TPR) repeat protein
LSLFRPLLLAAALAAAPRILPAQGHLDVSVSLAELEKRVKADSNDPAAHYNAAMGEWAAKKWDDADRELHTAIKLQPRFAEAHLALAFLPLARDQHMLDPYRGTRVLISALPEKIQAGLKQRTDEYRRAFVIDPMVDLRIVAANSDSPDYWDMRDYFGDTFAKYFNGVTQCQQGEYADCENTLTIAINDLIHEDRKGDPVPNDAYWYRGLAAAHVKHYDAALADFNKLITRDQKTVKKAEEKGLIREPMRTNEYHYFVAVFEQAAGKTDEAIATYQQAIEGDLGLYMAHVRLAEIYEGRKDLPKAIAERKSAIDANPDDPSLQVDLGITLGRAGKFAEAEDALKTATDAMPRSPEAWYWLGIAEQQLAKKGEAKSAFEHVVTLAPSRMQDLANKAKQRLAGLS